MSSVNGGWAVVHVHSDHMSSKYTLSTIYEAPSHCCFCNIHKELLHAYMSIYDHLYLTKHEDRIANITTSSAATQGLHDVLCQLKSKQHEKSH